MREKHKLQKKNYYENLISIHDDDNKDQEYEVEKIVDSQIINNVLHYFIKWKNWPSESNTWEPEQNLNGCQDLLDEYRKEKVKQEQSKKKLAELKRQRKLEKLEQQRENDFFSNRDELFIKSSRILEDGTKEFFITNINDEEDQQGRWLSYETTKRNIPIQLVEYYEQVEQARIMWEMQQ